MRGLRGTTFVKTVARDSPQLERMRLFVRLVAGQTIIRLLMIGGMKMDEGSIYSSDVEEIAKELVQRIREANPDKSREWHTMVCYQFLNGVLAPHLSYARLIMDVMGGRMAVRFDHKREEICFEPMD